MAVTTAIINFSSTTPQGAVQNLATNVPKNTPIRVRFLPERGNGQGTSATPANGGGSNQGGMPYPQAMIDNLNLVLPQYARLYRVTTVGGSEVANSDVKLYLTMETSAFSNNRPIEDAYFDLVFTPAGMVDNATYQFDYSPAIPGRWVPAEEVIFQFRTIDFGSNQPGGGFTLPILTTP